METYDKTYSRTNFVFGVNPEKTLVQFETEISKSTPVLDIGSGQGRNAIFLAKKGFKVDAIDTSKVAVKSLSKLSEEENYAIKATQSSFKEFNPKNVKYSAVLIFGLIQILDWESIHLLIKKVNKWTTKGSLIFITGFSTKDISFNRFKTEWKIIKKNSFKNNNGVYRTFLEPNEILSLFKNHTILHHWEGLGPKHQHGNNPIEQHEMIELVIQKK